jgi:uncharacterized membrane protein
MPEQATIEVLVWASLAFVGSHFILSHPLRAPLVRAVGERGFLGLYSLVALGTFVWMVLAFRRTPYQDMAWDGWATLPWVVSSLITVVALVLFLGSMASNPAFPGVQHPEGPMPAPRGVFRVTRHPMMWGFALWALSHILVAPTGRTIVLAGAILVLALVGAALQDGKKRKLVGQAWQSWEAQTSFWPNLARLGAAGWRLWLAALIAFLVLTWAHIPLAYVPAGPWRWLG